MYSSELLREISISGLWLAGSMLVYATSLWLYKRSINLKFLQPLFHPLITSTAVLLLVIYMTGIQVADYQSHTQILSLLLGPATVALAIPLYQQFRILIKMNWRVLLPIALASFVAPCLAWFCVYLVGAPLNMQMTMLVKSITTPLAMDAASLIGGIAPLAAVFVITSGIVGAAVGPGLFKLCRVSNHAAQGIALGAVSHAIGTAKAISVSQQCAAFATLALCINGLTTALILPFLFAGYS